MIRQTFGTVLPSTNESHVGDRFYNITTNEYFIFDDGQWLSFPEAAISHSDLPTPTTSDAGKGVFVGADGKYKLGGLSAATVRVPSAGFASDSVNPIPAGEVGRVKVSLNEIFALLPEAQGTLIIVLPFMVLAPNGQLALPMPVVGYMNTSGFLCLDIKNEAESSTTIGFLMLIVLYKV